MYKNFGLNTLRVLSSFIFVVVLGFLAFDVNNKSLQQELSFVLNSIFIVLLFSSGFIFVFNTNTLKKQDSVNYFVTRIKELVPVYVVCTLIAYIVAIILNQSETGLYESNVALNLTSAIRDFLMVVDIQKGDFIYPIIYHSWPMLVEMGIVYVVFFYFIFKENSSKRKKNDVYRDVFLFVALLGMLTFLGFDQYLALQLYVLPDLMKGIIFLFLNNNYLLLPFAIGIASALLFQCKPMQRVSAIVQTILGVCLLGISSTMIYSNFQAYLSNTVVDIQANGSPKIYWLLLSTCLLCISFVWLEPLFQKLWLGKQRMLRYAYVQFLISDVAVYQVIVALNGSTTHVYTLMEKIGVLAACIVLMQLSAMLLYKGIDHYIYKSSLFEPVPVSKEEDAYVDN